MATGQPGAEGIALEAGIFRAEVIEGAMPSAVGPDLTEPGLERTPAAAHRAWVPAEALEAGEVEEEAVAGVVAAAVVAVAGEDSRR